MSDTKILIQSALKFIGIRPRSSAEIRKFIAKKTTSANQIEEVIDYLDTHKFINDEEFARWYIDSRQRSNPKSQQMLKFELRKYGIHLSTESIASDDTAAAERVLDRYSSRLEKLTPFAARAKAYQYLKARGFSSSGIAAALKKRYNTSRVNDD